MNTFKKFLTEKFINAFQDDTEIKTKYVDDVWDILQKSYSDIGGIKGSGFNSKEDMINKIPFWKIALDNGKPVAVIMYKDSNGRKSVAIGTDGSVSGKDKVTDIIKNDFKRSFGEKSKAALGIMMKTVEWDVLQSFTMTPKEAQTALGKPVTALKDYKGEIPEDGLYALNRYPQLKEYAYIRDIMGHPAFKVSFGVVGIKIK